MRAVVHVREEELAERRAKGLDRWDEMWEGVLHMTPAPSVEHQRIVMELVEFLRPLLRESGRGTLIGQVNVFHEVRPFTNYRIPDLVFVAAGREHVLARDGVRGEGPDAVIEIRSPEDETYEKLPFYAAIGVREAIVCDRDSKAIEIFRLEGVEYVALHPGGDGWLFSTVLGVKWRRADGLPACLQIEDLHDRSRAAKI